MEALCIAPQPTPPIPFFSFNVGDSFNSNLQYGWRVRRWWNTDTYDPFRDDSHYSLKTFSSSTKKAIRSQHALPLAVTTVLFECGKKFVNADGSQERFFLPAEAHLDDGRYEKGVITLGRIPQSQLIFHYHFSQLAPSTLCRSYAKDGFFQSYDDEDSSCEVEPECVDPRKTLPLDKSEISAISDTKLGTIEVTVSDPERGRTIILFVEKPD